MTNDIVIDLRLMSEELLTAANVIEAQRKIMKEMKLKFDELLAESKPQQEEADEPVKPKVTKGGKKQTTEEQLAELTELVKKDKLTAAERRKAANLRYRLKQKGIVDFPERPRGRPAENPEAVKKEEKPAGQLQTFRGKDKKAFTLSEELKPEPEAGTTLFNCFKEVRPGRWEHDGVNLTLEDARDTIKDLKMEGFRAVMQPASLGYVYRG